MDLKIFWLFASISICGVHCSISPPLYEKFLHLSNDEVAAIQPKAGKSYLLPDIFEPLNYDILLEPLFHNFTFKGEVTVTAKVKKPTDTIYLHALNITMESFEIKIANVVTSDFADTYDENLQFLKFSRRTIIPANEMVNVKITYRGILNEGNKGFYRAQYFDRNGNEKWMATTQFESTDARRAFPCFDEPALKATFKIRIIRDANLNAVANTPLVKSEHDLASGKYTDEFDVTTKMSTYLIAFAVSDFSNVSDTKNAYPHEVMARDFFIAEGRGDYALQLSHPMMDVIEKFVNKTNYFNKKMTQIAIPDDWYNSGAMENWGLVTYKEGRLLFKSGIHTSLEKQRIALVVAHEYGHQWFGNLVGPEWWTWIWLNEGFATYFEHWAASEIEKDMRLMEQYTTQIVQYSMNFDQDDKTRALTTEAFSPDDISALFDPIAYEKGGSVIRMMEHFVTTDLFRKGLNQYLTDRDHSFANEDHLWDAFDKIVSAQSLIKLPSTVKEIMKKWSMQPGFPVVDVSRTEEGKINLTQTHFVVTGKPLNSLWNIPINFATKTSPGFTITTAQYWSGLKKETVLDVTLKADDWIILNKQNTGYYRVNYSPDLWQKIINLLANPTEFTKIPAVNRAQILDDAFHMAIVGKISYNLLFELLDKYARQETDYIPVYSLIQGLTTLEKLTVSLAQKSLFRNFAVDILTTAYNKLGNVEKPTDSHIDRLNREIILRAMCNFGSKSCLDKMLELFVKGDRITPDMQNAVYCGAMRAKGEQEFLRLLSLYGSSQIEDLERTRVALGMGCLESKIILENLLKGTLNIHKRNKVGLLSAIYSGSELGLDLALDFVLSSLKVEPKSEGYTKDQLKNALKGISSRVSKAEQVKKIRDYLAGLNVTQEAKFKEEVERNLVANEGWVARSEKDVNSWLVTKYTTKTPDNPDSALNNTFNAFLLIFSLLLVGMNNYV